MLVTMFGFAVPSSAITLWYHARFDLPIVPISNEWTCPFAQPNGAYDWAHFSPFSPALINLQRKTTGNFRWDNGRTWASGIRIEVPTMARISGNNGFYDTGGMGNRAVIQAIYAAFLNRHTPLSGMSIDPRGSLLVNDLIPAMYSDDIMTSVINQVRSATGIDDGGYGSVEQLAAGLQAGSGYYLSCAPGGLFGAGSSQIYTSIDFMPNINVSGFTDLLLDGTVMILQTNKLVWNSSRNAWGYGEDGLYLVKSVTRQAVLSTSGTSYTHSYTLYDVATGSTKTVKAGNASIRNIWSTGSISGSHTVAFLDDGNDYMETIIGFAGMDPLVNRY